MGPFFSIIIPTHNGEERIERALQSIKSQTFTDYEILVVCDDCTDKTEEVARTYNAKVVVGTYNRDGLARNAGINASMGEWIMFVDDDDWLLHEYCLEQLADAVKLHDVDVVDFDFVWKGEGVKTPSEAERYVMVWCRIWRRSFIGKNRFNDIPYGSDKEFFIRKIQNNPSVRIFDLHSTIYYYNYMREGSLSWHEHKKILLDIVLTHYDEPWNECKPFFDMLRLQRNVDLHQVSVTVVQDMHGQPLHWRECLHDYPFNVQFITCTDVNNHPRNVGFAAGNADWVLFCDIDDMFADICSLRMILDQLPVYDYDVIWTKYIVEQRWNGSGVYLNKVDEANLSSVVGKLYRRAFLQEKNITFTSSIPMYTDYIFNAIVTAETQPFRIVQLITDFYVYCKNYRKNGQSHRIENIPYLIDDRFTRDVYLAQEFLNRGLAFAHNKAVWSALLFEYFKLYDPNDKNENEPSINNDWSRAFAEQHADSINALSNAEIDVVRDAVETETMNLVQRIYNDHQIEYYLVKDTLRFPFAAWKLIATSGILSTQPAAQKTEISTPVPVNFQERAPHVAVYCGTYNTYLNMLTSAKSLLYNTPMDKIYFLIEDDTFPYEIPDTIECINVKNQSFFTTDGPNFDNAWTYMCMLRAAFTKLIPYDKVLSLDVDVIVNEDISCLWNLDMHDHYLAGVIEPQRQKSTADPPYINFGVVMMNLAKLRADKKDDDIIYALNHTKFGCPEQDAFNKLCAWHILTLPNDYNATIHSHITGDAQRERIVHYAGIKFWRHYSNVKQYADIDWNDVMQQQFKLKGASKQ